MENFWAKSGKKKVDEVGDAAKVIRQAETAKPKPVDLEAVYLKLTDELSFSMTDFDKVNKGMRNSNINCYMNVCLQSLIACPAFFNMLTLVSENADLHPDTLSKDKEVLGKFVSLSRYFEPKIQVMDNAVNKFQGAGLAMYQDKVVDAEAIFATELLEFNPEAVQADCSEFLSYILDKLHEEMKDIYVSNAPKNEEQKTEATQSKGQDTEWNETGEGNAKITYNNHEDLQKIQNSIIRDIFGGIVRTEFFVEGSRNHRVTFESCFVLTLDIPYDGCTIEECLDGYFRRTEVQDYKQNGKVVKAY